MRKNILPRSFYEKPTLAVAQHLLGCFLVRAQAGKLVRAMITETEAYIGEDDLACHASKGRTQRTEIMYGKAGHAYVYLVYGMHELLNVVTEKKGFPAAVLIRAVKLENIPIQKTNGPGKLTAVLGIDRTLNTHDLTSGKALWIERGESIERKDILTSPRIGIGYAKHCARYPWRFELKPNRRETA